MSKEKLKIPKNITDVKLYDKDKYDKLLLCSYEFKRGDLIVNEEGRTYKIKYINSEYMRVKFLFNNNEQIFIISEYDHKKVVLRLNDKYRSQRDKEKNNTIKNFVVLSVTTIYTAILLELIVFNRWGELITPQPFIMGSSHISAFIILTVPYLVIGYLWGKD